VVNSVAQCNLRVLGGFALTAKDGGSLALPTKKDRLLLAFLALHPGQPQPREKLYGLLWADRGEEQARGSLRQSLASLRDAFQQKGIDALIVNRDSVTLNASELSVDALDFLNLATEPKHFDQAVDLYRGPLLADHDAPSAEYGQWLLPARQRLEEQAGGLVESIAAADAPPIVLNKAVALAHQLIGRDSLREPLYRALMRLKVKLRDRAGAMKTYAECREVLTRELNLTPELETEQLYRDILTDRPAAPVSQTEFSGFSERPRIAVMPFSNIGGDAALAPLCEGLAEDIITGLGKFRLLFVIDRNSSTVVHQMNPDTAEIGKKLGVSLVVQGSLQRLGNQIRIRVRLVNAAERTQVWGEDFDCEAGDLPAIPARIGKAIIVTLYNRVEDSLLEQSRRKPKLTAYEFLLRGVKHLRGYGPEDNQRALELFQRAVDLDPDYALARAYLGFADLVLHDYDAAPPHILERARTMAQEAVEMTPDDYRCHWLLGMILGTAGDLENEERHYLQALSLNPNDANTRSTYGILLGMLGRVDEGIDSIREAMRLNPYHPEWYWVDLGSVLYVAKRYEDAIEAFRKRIRPEAWVLSRLAACHAQLGRMDDAAKAAAEVMRQNPDFRISAQRSGGWLLHSDTHLREGMIKAGLPE
jgi:DNA-binding SARP family transcriptional activator/TolB-like protein/Flp pilus assembly protein TadD